MLTKIHSDSNRDEMVEEVFDALEVFSHTGLRKDLDHNNAFPGENTHYLHLHIINP